jgi:hypothetical protein
MRTAAAGHRTGLAGCASALIRRVQRFHTAGMNATAADLETPRRDALLAQRLDAPDVRQAREPFPWLVATGMVDEAARDALRDAFPIAGQAGFIPHDPAACGAAFNALVAQLVAPAFADALGERLGLAALSTHPVLVTVCSRLNRRHGTIHTDSRSKIASALLYLNERWDHGSAGNLRLLARGDDIGALLTPEIAPVFGTLVAFQRTDCSFHGHLPFEGERRVVQFAWLTDADALARKTRRGLAQRWLKRLFGPLDRWLGGRRGVNDAHRD